MSRFTLPDWVQQHLFLIHDNGTISDELLLSIQNGLKQYQVEDPEVSIVIPAYNEEENLYQTLSSFSKMNTRYRTELLVVNNNSTDRTQQILDNCGVRSVFEPRQGISYTRQTGFEKARGKFMLNADADSIYPANWANVYVDALKQHPEVSCVYGSHSFIPSEGSSRITLGLYELVAETMFRFRSKTRGFTNVLGFNFAFRKEDGVKVGGFNTRRQRWQDGWMAMMLMQYGSLKHIKTVDARVWTSDRRLMVDGSLGKAFINRLIRHSKKLLKYAGLKSFNDNHDAPVKTH